MRSGREHWTWLLVVEVRQGTLEDEEGRKGGREDGRIGGRKAGGRKEATNIKI